MLYSGILDKDEHVSQSQKHPSLIFPSRTPHSETLYTNIRLEWECLPEPNILDYDTKKRQLRTKSVGYAQKRLVTPVTDIAAAAAALPPLQL